MNPTLQHTKRPIVFPESIPDTEAERTAEARRLIHLIEGFEAKNDVTSFEYEVIEDIKDGKAATRTRLTIIRDAYKRLKRKHEQ